jgi:hypothetical protein
VQEARRDCGRAGPHYRYAPVKGSLTPILAHHPFARTHSCTRRLCAKLCMCMQVARLEELSSLFESRLSLLETTVALSLSEHLSCLGAVAVAISHGCDLRHRIWDSDKDKCPAGAAINFSSSSRHYCLCRICGGCLLTWFASHLRRHWHLGSMALKI